MGFLLVFDATVEVGASMLKRSLLKAFDSFHLISEGVLEDRHGDVQQYLFAIGAWVPKLSLTCHLDNTVESLLFGPFWTKPIKAEFFVGAQDQDDSPDRPSE